MSASNGIVALSGTVPSVLAEDRAILVAETVEGVRAVVDRMEVEPPEVRSDEAAGRDVQSALIEDPATSATTSRSASPR